MSYLVSRTVTVDITQYEKLRKQKGVKFNFSQWVRSCIANEIGEELDFDQEQEYQRQLDEAPRVKLPDGKELIVVDDIVRKGHKLSEDEEFVLQCEEWMERGNPLPEKTQERYEAAKQRIQGESE